MPASAHLYSPDDALAFPPDQRRAVRHPIDLSVIAERANHEDLKLRLINISPDGFLATGAADVARGERLLMRLPVVGRIEAQLVWHSEPRAGFRFERLIRLGDLTRLLVEVGPRSRADAGA